MLQIRTILFPTDFSEAAGHALPFAVSLAEEHEAALHMVHALVLHEADPGDATHRFPNMQELYEVLHASAEERLTAVAEEHGGEELEVHTAQRRGISAAPVILDYANDNDIDLIVMGTHGRRGLRRLLLGSVTEEVVRLAPCPVMTIPEKEEARTLENAGTIVAPVDFSEHSRLAVSYAKELAGLYGARLHLVHVIDEVVFPDFYVPVMVSPASVSENLKKQATERLQRLDAETTGPDVESEVHVLSGHPPGEIVEFADQQDAGLIVIASHGLTGLRHMVLGSVTEHVVRRSTCPVFTLKTFGKSLLHDGAD